VNCRLIWRPTKKSIHGEIALVTGAGHGMGQLIALKMAKLGATVIVSMMKSLKLKLIDLTILFCVK